MIEVPVSSLVANFGKYGVTGYSLTSNFEGSSVYFGVQGGISYAINDMISVYAGGRYVWAKNTYKGDVKDISVITAAGSQRAQSMKSFQLDSYWVNNLRFQLSRHKSASLPYCRTRQHAIQTVY